MNKKTIKRRILLLAVCSLLSTLLFSTTAFAYSKEETVSGNEAVPPTEPEPIAYDPLTPDGNLSLVDDLGETTGCGKQFITVVTKTGNFFYIIIDRDDEGESTVHFLNQVDEADLMKLMEEEEAAAFIEEPEEEPVIVEEESKEEVQEPKKKSNAGAVICLLLFVLIGCGGFVYLKSMEKKKKKQQQPDPDADYEDDFLVDISDELADEEEEIFSEEEDLEV